MLLTIAISIFGLVAAAASIVIAVRMVPAYGREQARPPGRQEATQKSDQYGEELQLLRYMVEQLWAERENPRTTELERRRYRRLPDDDLLELPSSVYPLVQRSTR